MDIIITKTLLWCSLWSHTYIFLVIFFFFNVVLTLPYLCKYLAYVVSKGVSWKDTKIVGSLFSFFTTSAVLNSILPLYKILQGVSPQMQYFRLVSFKKLNWKCVYVCA